MQPASPPLSRSDAVAPAADIPQRLVSLDAYRGLVMLAMASRGFGIPKVAALPQFSQNPTWQFLAAQLDHVAWVGSCFWDLIQPSFMFMVGVAMAYSCASRVAKGQSYLAMLCHAILRAILLVALGIFLRSNTSDMTNFTLMDVTSQIGLGYVPLFLLWGRKFWIQATAATVILVGYFALFALYPLPAADYDFAAVGVDESWVHFEGFERHWEKNANVAHDVDVKVLNWLPRPEPFLFDRGGYNTLNFIPSIATMIFGLIAGEWLRGGATGAKKFFVLVGAGLALLLIGWGLNELGICPVVKRIWTPSWALYSTGWTCLLLGAFFAVIDLANFRFWAFPLVVIGMNSIAIYCMDKLCHAWTLRTLRCHLGWVIEALRARFAAIDKLATDATIYLPIIETTAVILIFWLVLLWMYRRRIFLRI